MRFKIYETRVQVYSCTIEAKSIEEAQEQYDKDRRGEFALNFQHEGTDEIEQDATEELDEDGNIVCIHS